MTASLSATLNFSNRSAELCSRVAEAMRSIVVPEAIDFGVDFEHDGPRRPASALGRWLDRFADGQLHWMVVQWGTERREPDRLHVVLRNFVNHWSDPDNVNDKGPSISIVTPVPGPDRLADDGIELFVSLADATQAVQGAAFEFDDEYAPAFPEYPLPPGVRYLSYRLDLRIYERWLYGVGQATRYWLNDSLVQVRAVHLVEGPRVQRRDHGYVIDLRGGVGVVVDDPSLVAALQPLFPTADDVAEFLTVPTPKVWDPDTRTWS